MRNRSLPAVLSAVVVVAAAFGLLRSGSSRPASPKPAATRAFAPLVGLELARPGAGRSREHTLVRVDPDSLRARAGRGVRVGSMGCAARSGGEACWAIPPWSASADRSLLAVVRNDRSAARSVRVVDVRRMRVRAEIPVTGGALGLIAWPAAARMLALQEICCDERQQLLVLDVARRRVAARRALEGTVVRAGRTARELVLLIAPAKRIGPARLAVIDERGAVRFVALDDVRAGSKLEQGFDYQVELPGLAIDPDGRRAFVVGRDLIAAVDLERGAAEYHVPARPVSLLGRLRDWVDPVAHAKGASGPTRSAHWLGGGMLAVAGSDEESFSDAGGSRQTRVRPAGLSLVDTRDWSVRTLDPGATAVRVTGDLLLATGSSWDSATGEREAIGLTVYGFDGDKRYQRLAGRDAWVEHVHRGRAYVMSMPVGAGRASLRTVDLATGRTNRASGARRPWPLVEPASSWWDG